MRSELTELQHYIGSEYGERLEIDLGAGGGESPEGTSTVWRWQNAKLVNISNEDDPSGAILVDSEIGLCLFFQIFDKRVDVRSQVAQSLRLRSQLQPNRAVSDKEADALGEWRVALNWLVERDDFDAWVEGVSSLRQETAHFEEVPVDAIVNWDDDWAISIRKHGVPRLLFHVREIIRKTSIDEATAWVNADDQISEKVREIANRTETDLERRYADQVIGELGKYSKQEDDDIVLNEIDNTHELKSICVEKFRNINEITMVLRGKDELVSSNIIQGPNGSGKSSIYEALSIALSGVSGRYIEFLRDPNYAGKKSAEAYLNDYLSSLWGERGRPKLAINNEPPKSVELLDPDTAEQTQRNLSGSFLSQASVDSLLHMRAEDLGAIVVGNYSRLANRLYEFAEERLQSAINKRVEFNKRWGLRANVSKPQTAKERMSDFVLSRSFPNPNAFISWTKLEAFSNFTGLAVLPKLGREWQELIENRGVIVRELSNCEDENDIEPVIKSYSKKFSELARRAQEVLMEVNRRSERIYDGLADAIKIYGDWVSASAEPTKADGVDIDNLKSEIAAVTSKLEKISSKGRALRNRISNIESAMKLFRDELNVIAPNNCPTCDTDLSSRGGVLKALEEVLEESREEILRLRDEYNNTNEHRSKLQSELGGVGEAVPPMDDSELTRLQEVLNAVFGSEINLAHWLGDKENRKLVLDAISAIENRPSSLDLSDPKAGEKVTSEAIRALSSAFDELAEVSAAPDAWSAVEKLLLDAFVSALLEHLPRSVQALWLEISRNIMPAPWQYPGDARFDIQHRKGKAEARIVVRGANKSPLAAHILNGAEVHNLALAWFFVQYLTFGRFHYQFLVLDDPAQQMDQPTYRDLCRLMESILRLHRHHSIPLTLLVFLHQDGRALDAARATNGTLHLLRWNRGTPALMRSMKIRSDMIAPPNAYSVLPISL